MSFAQFIFDSSSLDRRNHNRTKGKEKHEEKKKIKYSPTGMFWVDQKELLRNVDVLLLNISY